MSDTGRRDLRLIKVTAAIMDLLYAGNGRRGVLNAKALSVTLPLITERAHVLPTGFCPVLSLAHNSSETGGLIWIKFSVGGVAEFLPLQSQICADDIPIFKI
jgi:hypothetical protein